jgi:NADH:ubiquinone oxidoreductase subunit 2 (subunit N)
MLGKVYIFSSAFSLSDGHSFRGPLVVLAVIGVINSAIAAVYYLRIAGTCYLREPLGETAPAGDRPLRVGVAICSVAMLLLFVRPQPLVQEARSASDGMQAPAVAAQADVATDTIASD